MIYKIAKELSIKPNQAEAVIELLQEGATIPFIARYRKEKTGSLDEVAIQAVRDRFEYLTELNERKAAVLASMQELGKWTPEFAKTLEVAETKQQVEDLYAPFKPKRRTRAQIAREMGLEPLADLLQAQADPAAELARLSQEEVTKALAPAELLERARDILAERVAERPDTKERIRQLAWSQGVLLSKAKPDWAAQKSKFGQYYDFQEPIAKLPAHRFLAMRRGEEEGVLRLDLVLPEQEILTLLRQTWLNPQKPGGEMEKALGESWNRLLGPSIEVDLRLELKTRSDDESIQVFGLNLKELLLAAPAGEVTVLGLDPGLRTGSKYALIDATGKLTRHGTLYTVGSKGQLAESLKELQFVIDKEHPHFIAIGNGTGSRELMTLLRGLDLGKAQPVIVNEAGASVYSASAIAREEFPDLDVSLRGAVSIARRLQDPLAELVKIDPKSIGVGQYQHDVNQRKLQRGLEEAVVFAVNQVGVNLNQASKSLLSYVSGLNAGLAEQIVSYRNQKGAFKSRKELLEVPRFGPKAFEQAAGFLRLPEAANPLDASGVHPERYKLVEAMAQDLGLGVKELVANSAALGKINKNKYVNAEVGLPTLNDILQELVRPGRDPRSTFEAPTLDDAVTCIEDVKPGMELEGRVTNLTKFGAFVDIGVHQDGLVHVSELADRFISDPSEVVKPGQVLKVRVLEVDYDLKRIRLSAKLGGGDSGIRSAAPSKQPTKKATPAEPAPTGVNALLDKFKRL